MTYTVEAEIAGRTLAIETGRLAQQAGGAVTVRYGDTMLLGTATASTPRPGIDFFPLSVEFEERLYAAGRIPGSFFRREGRPTTTAILSARLTDRPLRPLFPKGYNDDTQVIITIFSVDMENPPDTLGTIAASAALCISDIPFDGPVASVRIGHVDGELILQPTFAQLEQSDLNLVVAGTHDAITMVEAEAGEVPESLLVDALALGQEAIATICELQQQLAEETGVAKRAFTADTIDPDALAFVDQHSRGELEAVFSAGTDKAETDQGRKAVRDAALEAAPADADRDLYKAAFDELEKQIVRANILERGERPDGRGTTDLRALSADTGLVPRTHGSGLFQRGETQVLSITTLAGSGMAQRLDDLTPEDSKRFMHHYNFPPFSVGETGRVGNPNRRSIGHGMLGERAMQAILPPFEEFPYVIRIVSEVLSSNGSTSMASVCASVLSMMDAGVPIRTPIAGIAMGAIKGDDDVAILTDIAGIEDHLGDMDFKVAGSREGVTALQMDMKVKGIDLEILASALEQARDARLEIMDVMTECIAEPRNEMSEHAPRILRIDVPTEKIGQLIGPGGRSIRALEEETGADISVEDGGVVFITAVNAASGKAAYERIEGLTREIEPGQIYTGKVVRILPFGAFVEMVPGKDALVHISELADYHVDRVEDVVKMGDVVTVVVTEIDNLGRVNASCKALLDGGDGGGGRPPRERAPRERGPRRESGPRRDRDGDRGGDGGRDRDRGRAGDDDNRGERRRRSDDSRNEPRPARERRPRRRRDAAPVERTVASSEPRDEPRHERREEPNDEPHEEMRPAEFDAPEPELEPATAEVEREELEDRSDGDERSGMDMPDARDESEARDDRDDREVRGERPAGSGGAAIVQPRDPGARPRRRRRRRRGGAAGPAGEQSQDGPGDDGGAKSARTPEQPPARREERQDREEREERQPDHNTGNRRAGRGILSRVGLRRDDPGDGPPPPPPPPRSDFGAPSR